MEKLFHSMRSANSSADYEFSSVDRLFVSQRLPLQKCVADVFKDEVHKMDFVLDPELARMYINNWVANQTNGQIKDLIPTSMITHTTRLVLVRRTTGTGNSYPLPSFRPQRSCPRPSFTGGLVSA